MNLKIKKGTLLFIAEKGPGSDDLVDKEVRGESGQEKKRE